MTVDDCYSYHHSELLGEDATLMTVQSDRKVILAWYQLTTCKLLKPETHWRNGVSIEWFT